MEYIYILFIDFIFDEGRVQQVLYKIGPTWSQGQILQGGAP